MEKPLSHTSIRRSRILLYASILAAVIYFYGAPWTWGISGSLSENSAFYSSRLAHKLGRKGTPVDEHVDEIYGLLHLVTRPDQLQLRDDMDIDPSQPLKMAHYTAGDEEIVWGKVKRTLDKEAPVIIFSKTYCPYSKRAKALIEGYDLSPKPTIIEVDLRSDQHIIKRLLTRLTNHGTFPNVIVHGRSIGGSDDVATFHDAGQLKHIFESAGVSVRGKV